MNPYKASGVLAKIGQSTQNRIQIAKKNAAESYLRANVLPGFKPKDFAKNLRVDGTRVIAEVKFKSPSQGDIAPLLEPLDVAKDYLAAGAAAISVLTEPEFFGGDIDYLRNIRKSFPDAYLLMKDFFIDPYQLHQALWAGADAILIIVGLLGKEGSKKMFEKASKLGLTSLVEVHDQRELDIAKEISAPLIGINNRNLKDMTISLDTTERLIQDIKSDITIVGESGIRTRKDLKRLKKAGCHGFLIGSSLMASGQPGLTLSQILKED